jgi:hypothetical protein
VPIDLKTLRLRLARFGADLATWPAEDAEAAVDLLAASTAAQDLFARATAKGFKATDGASPDLQPLVDKIVEATRPAPSPRK